MNTQKILGLGNALVDIIIPMDNDQHLSELKLPKGSMQLIEAEQAKEILTYFTNSPKTLASGGSASNTIHGIANLGGQTAFIGIIGQDEYGKFFEQDMRENGIVSLLTKKEISTGTAITLMSPDSERTFATYLGAACTLSAADLNINDFKGYDYLHIEGYLVQNYELIETALKLAKEAGLQISYDLASYNVVEENLEFIKKIITNSVDIVFANEEEAKALTGLNEKEALDEIAKICKIAVVKIGKRGSLIKEGDKTISIQPFDAECIDTNGAGDAYASGFLYGKSINLPLEKCGEIGSYISSKVVGVTGPKLNSEKWGEIKTWLSSTILN